MQASDYYFVSSSALARVPINDDTFPARLTGRARSEDLAFLLEACLERYYESRFYALCWVNTTKRWYHYTTDEIDEMMLHGLINPLMPRDEMHTPFSKLSTTMLRGGYTNAVAHLLLATRPDVTSEPIIHTALTELPTNFNVKRLAPCASDYDYPTETEWLTEYVQAQSIAYNSANYLEMEKLIRSCGGDVSNEITISDNGKCRFYMRERTIEFLKNIYEDLKKMKHYFVVGGDYFVGANFYEAKAPAVADYVTNAILPSGFGEVIIDCVDGEYEQRPNGTGWNPSSSDNWVLSLVVGNPAVMLTENAVRAHPCYTAMLQDIKYYYLTIACVATSDESKITESGGHYFMPCWNSDTGAWDVAEVWKANVTTRDSNGNETTTERYIITSAYSEETIASNVVSQRANECANAYSVWYANFIETEGREPTIQEMQAQSAYIEATATIIEAVENVVAVGSESNASSYIMDWHTRMECEECYGRNDYVYWDAWYCSLSISALWNGLSLSGKTYTYPVSGDWVDTYSQSLYSAYGIPYGVPSLLGTTSSPTIYKTESHKVIGNFHNSATIASFTPRTTIA